MGLKLFQGKELEVLLHVGTLTWHIIFNLVHFENDGP